MSIDDAGLLAFIHIERTGGTTMTHILRSTFGERHCDIQPIQKLPKGFTPLVPKDLHFAQKLYPRLRCIAGHSVMPCVNLEQIAKLQYFTILRDPVKQCASCYQYSVNRFNDAREFEEWIQDEWWQNMQTKRIAGLADPALAYQIILEKKIFVGLLESFDESLLLLKKLLINDLNVQYIKRNVAPSQAIARRLIESPSELALLMKATEADRALYVRVKRELYPDYLYRYNKEADQSAAVTTPDHSGTYRRLQKILSFVHRNLVYRPALRIERIVSTAKTTGQKAL